MTRIGTSIEERLTLAQVAITNALADLTLQEALAEYGYTTDRFRQGQALRESALALYQRQKGAYGDLFAAADALDAAQRQAHDSYMRHIKVARIALKDDRGAQQTLNLASRRKRTFAGWLAQAQQFYANALADRAILDRLAAFGITQSALATGQLHVEAIGTGDAARHQRKGAAQDATRARDAALAALDAWMSDFVKIARVALQDRPQLLEQLGVAAPARRTSRQPAPVMAPIATMLNGSAESTTASGVAASSADERRNGYARA
jgi:hypothetical protein